MWQRFTEQARRAILIAQEEAAQAGATEVDTEHLLLALLGEGMASVEVLARMNAPAEVVRLAVAAELRASARPTGSHPEPRLSRWAKRALELAADEARLLSHNFIGTEHLLLALLRLRPFVWIDIDYPLLRLLNRVALMGDERLEKHRLETRTYHHIVAPAVLHRLGLDLDSTRVAVSEHLYPEDQVELGAETQGIILTARKEAQLAGNGRIGTAHLLLALLANPNGSVCSVLQQLSASPVQVRHEMKRRNCSDTEVMASQPRLTREARRVLTLAAAEARALGCPSAQPEHMLLALLADRDSRVEALARWCGLLPDRDDLAATVLRELGVGEERLRAVVRDAAR